MRMKLTRNELQCLRALVNEKSARASAIARATGIARPHISRVTAVLQEKGLVTTERAGFSTIVSLSDAKHALLWRKLAVEFGHMPLEDLLTGASLEILSTISFLDLRNRNEIAEYSLVSEASVARVLERFKQMGMIQKTVSGYTVRTRFRTLGEFVMEFRHYLNERIARDFASDAVILWECNTEFIIESKTTEAKDGFQSTGPSTFARFGVPLITTTSHFFYSPLRRKLRLEDVVLHSILLPDRSMLPILLVWKKNEHEVALKYLEELAAKYDATEVLKDVVTYFASRGAQRAEGYPPWNEFALKAREYGII